MSKPDQDRIYRDIASKYVREYGQRLQQEKAGLDKDGVAYDTQRLDWLVQKQLMEQKNSRSHRRKTVTVAVLAAACLLLVILIPVLGEPGGLVSDGMESASAAPAEDAAEAPAEPEFSPEEVPVIPLSFTLPDNFTVSAVELDQGTSIYYLDDTKLDDVVMTLDYLEGPPLSDGLVELDLAGTPAYGRSNGDFNLLAFVRDDIQYVLTCKHDINTLVALGSNIVEKF